MWKLIQPKRRERGAAAVVVAISMVALMGFAAVAIDLGGAYSERQQLQNGVDSAALAIAESCQSGACPANANDYAKKLVLANKVFEGEVSVTASGVTSPVTVTAKYTRTNWFASVIGIRTTDVPADATAEWGYVSGGSTLPITFSRACFWAATDGWDLNGVPTVETQVDLILGPDKNCTFPAHTEVPGGFGWLTGSDCSSRAFAGEWVFSDPGNNGPNTCSKGDWASIQGQTLPELVPIFEGTRGSGRNAEYKIVGLAAFKVTGYCFGQFDQWGDLDNCPSKKRIQGIFTSYTDLKGDYSIDASAPHYGAGSVRLSR